jgi:hypothetical protein
MFLIGAIPNRSVPQLLLDQRWQHPLRADRVDRYSVIGEFDRRDLRHPQHAMPGGDVGDLLPTADEALRRGNVGEAAPAFLLMPGMAAFMPRNTPNMLVAMIASHRPSGKSSIFV